MNSLQKSPKSPRSNCKIISTKTKLLSEEFREHHKKKNDNRKLKIKLLDIFKGPDERNQLYRNIKALRLAQKKVDEEMDVVNILIKLQEVENMKCILFNKHQRMLFEMIAQPEIILDDDLDDKGDPGAFLFKEQKKQKQLNENELIELVGYFEHIKEKNHDDLDYRLFNLLDKDMKRFFEENRQE